MFVCVHLQTGTLTENRMTVVEGWFGTNVYQVGLPPPPISFPDHSSSHSISTSSFRLRFPSS